jgi:hypothetical protein
MLKYSLFFRYWKIYFYLEIACKQKTFFLSNVFLISGFYRVATLIWPSTNRWMVEACMQSIDATISDQQTEVLTESPVAGGLFQTQIPQEPLWK